MDEIQAFFQFMDNFDWIAGTSTDETARNHLEMILKGYSISKKLFIRTIGSWTDTLPESDKPSGKITTLKREKIL